MAKEGQLDDANIKLIQARIGKLNIDTETAEALKDLSVKELEAKISQMNASSTLTQARTTELNTRNAALPEQLAAELDETLARIGLVESQTTATIAEAGLTGTRADALRQDILLNEQFSATERQAALDLVEAKVLATGRYSDLEEFQVALLEDNRDLKNRLFHQMHKQKERTSVPRYVDNEERIGSSLSPLQMLRVLQNLLNKGAAPTVYNHFVRQNLQQFDVDFEYGLLTKLSVTSVMTKHLLHLVLFANANTVWSVYAFDSKSGYNRRSRC